MGEIDIDAMVKEFADTNYDLVETNEEYVMIQTAYRQGVVDTLGRLKISTQNNILKNNEIIEMDDYVIIGWPEIQDYMEEDGFEDNATLITPNESMGIGSSTYLMNKEWIYEQN